jgi:hypothetical protein
MDFGIGRVLKLLGHESIRRFRHQGVGLGDRAFHPFGGGGEDQLGAEEGQEGAAFQRHAFRHGEDELVALGCGDESQGNAGVAGGGLDDDRVLVDLAGFFARLDHGQADAVFHAAEGIEEFALEQDGRAGALRDAVQLDERRAADGLENAIVDGHNRFGLRFVYDTNAATRSKLKSKFRATEISSANSLAYFNPSTSCMV